MLGRRQWMGAALGLLASAASAGLSLGCNEQGGAGATGASPNKDPGATGAAVTEWKVGAFLSLSGAETAFGKDTREGIELAVDEVNAAGGAKGKPMKVIFEDDKSNPQEATNKVLQLIDRDKVVAILGEVASARSKAGGIVANRKKIPMITPSSTNPEVTKVGPFVFRVCFTDDVQGRLAAEFVVKTLGKKKIGILYASDVLYSSGLAKEFKDEAGRLGAQVAIEKSFLQTETNFTTYINELKGAGVDVIYAPTYYNHMVPIARQAKAAGVKGEMFVGGDGWDAEELLKDAGDEIDGAYFTNHYAPDVPWPNSKKFVEKYTERFKRSPTSLAAMGYDATKVLADAIGRSKTDTPEGIRDAIATTKDFQGATGNITINAERNAEKPVVVVQIKGKKFVYHSTVGGGAAVPAAAGSAGATPAAGSASAAPAAGTAAPTATAATGAASAKVPPASK
jgi:branched-chain amino acid transport system substrate-binding protein